MFFIHYKDITFGTFIVMFCFFYTLVSFGDAFYRYIKYLSSKKNDDEDKIKKTKKYITLNPYLFFNVFEEIIKSSNKKIADNKNASFLDGRMSAYSEVINLFKNTFSSSNDDFKTEIYNKFEDIIIYVITNADVAVEKSSNDTFFDGRRIAYQEILNIIQNNYRKLRKAE